MKESLTREKDEEIYRLLLELKQAQDSEMEIKGRIIDQCLDLVGNTAKSLVRKARYQTGSIAEIDVRDLTQEAILSLLDEIIDRFDPDRGPSFRSYASAHIKWKLLHYLRDEQLVKMPKIYERDQRISKARGRLLGELGREPLDSEIAEETGISIKQIKEVRKLKRTYTLVSLQDESFVEDDETLLDIIDGSLDDSDSITERRMTRDSVQILAKDLQRVIYLSFWRDFPQTIIARVLDISQMQVSRLLKEAKNILREYLEEDSEEASRIKRFV